MPNPDPSDSVEFTVASFNMQFGKVWDAHDPDDAPIRLDDGIAELRRLEADIILLQEIEQVDAQGGQIEPPPNFTRIRAALPEYHGFFAYPKADPRELPFGYGLAILSRAPLDHPQQIDLPAPDLSFEFDGTATQPTDRLLIGARTRIGPHELRIFNTHLQAFFMIDARSDDFPEQRARVLEQLEQSDLPTIIGGDFNCAPRESLLEQFAAAGYRSAQTSEITWKRMPFVLDHVLHNDDLTCVSHEVRPTPASDHHIVLARFRIG